VQRSGSRAENAELEVEVCVATLDVSTKLVIPSVEKLDLVVLLACMVVTFFVFRDVSHIRLSTAGARWCQGVWWLNL
jgi:hypothetical protein